MLGRVSAPLVLLAAGLGLALPARASAAEGPDRQQEKAFEKAITVTVKLKYLLYLPEGYEASDKDWPLILFLHGAGTTGDDLGRLRRAGLAKVVGGRKDFPFIVVSPLSPGRGWNPEALDALLDDVTGKYRADKDRIYLTGLSMGGFGAWSLAAAHPGRFAAIAPICGGGDPKRADRLKDVPVWAFHGAKDSTVPPARSEEMVEAIRAAGGDAKLTIYPDAGHDAWTQTYDNPELYEWFLKHRRRGAEK